MIIINLNLRENFKETFSQLRILTVPSIYNYEKINFVIQKVLQKIDEMFTTMKPDLMWF